MEAQDFYSSLASSVRDVPDTDLFQATAQSTGTPESRGPQVTDAALVWKQHDASFRLAFVDGIGHRMARPNSPSLLNDRSSQSVHEDHLGTPELLLAGGTFEERMIPGAGHAYLNDRSDSVCLRAAADAR